MLDKYLGDISLIILTHFKPLLFERETRCPFILGHPIVIIYFRF